MGRLALVLPDSVEAQVASLPEFRVFEGLRRTFTNVNDETDNSTHWDELGEKPRDLRFRT